MARELRGRRLLITGASRGIGRCLAEQAAEAGARLALTARSGDELRELADLLRQRGADVTAIPADLTNAHERQRMVEQAVRYLGGLDAVINNAGLASFGDFASSREEVLRQIMEINFFAPAELIRLCVPHLEQGDKPAIVNVASICGRRGIPTWPEHSASKFALVGLTESLRGELAPRGIDTLLVLPGLTKADDLSKHLLRNSGKLKLNFAGAQPPDYVAWVILRVLRYNWTETVVGLMARLVARLQQFFPWYLEYALARKVREMYRR